MLWAYIRLLQYLRIWVHTGVGFYYRRFVCDSKTHSFASRCQIWQCIYFLDQRRKASLDHQRGRSSCRWTSWDWTTSYTTGTNGMLSSTCSFGESDHGDWVLHSTSLPILDFPRILAESIWQTSCCPLRCALIISGYINRQTLRMSGVILRTSLQLTTSIRTWIRLKFTSKLLADLCIL